MPHGVWAQKGYRKAGLLGKEVACLPGTDSTINQRVGSAHVYTSAEVSIVT